MATNPASQWTTAQQSSTHLYTSECSRLTGTRHHYLTSSKAWSPPKVRSVRVTRMVEEVSVRKERENTPMVATPLSVSFKKLPVFRVTDEPPDP